MKKIIIYLSILVVIAAYLLVLSGFEWYGDESKDIKQGEKTLEEKTGSDISYGGGIAGLDVYSYRDEEYTYAIDKEDGSLNGYVAKDRSKDDGKNISDENMIIDIAKQAILKCDSNFFDTDVEYEIEGGENTDYHVYVHRISDNGLRTGNHAYVRLFSNGVVYSVYVDDSEDESIENQEVKISEKEAIEIAYEYAKQCILDLNTGWADVQENVDPNQIKPASDDIIYNDQGDPTSDDTIEGAIHELLAYLDDRESHEVTATCNVNNGKIQWDIYIYNVTYDITEQSKDNIMYFSIIIDANTGENIATGYSLTQ